jgi:hypothetical protein
MLTNAIVSPASATTQVRVQIDKITSGLNATDRIPVSVENMAQPTSVFSGQLTVTNAAQTLGANTLKSGVTVKALSTNTESIFIGVGSNVTVSNGYELSAGEGIFLEVNNTNNVGVISATSNGQKVCFMAS